MKVVRKIAIFMVYFCIQFISNSVLAEWHYGATYGYTMKDTPEEDSIEINVMAIQDPLANDKPLHARIFNEQLTREFQNRYKDTFGFTESQQLYAAPNPYNPIDSTFQLRTQNSDINRERKKFAEFMLRRLVEFHVDDYMKTDPRVRPVYEIKEKISNVKVEVARMRIDGQYQFSVNTLEIRVAHPWLTARLTGYMPPGGFLGNLDEAIIALNRTLTKRISAEARYAYYDAIITGVTRWQATARIGTSLTLSTYTKEPGKSLRESLYLLGMYTPF